MIKILSSIFIAVIIISAATYAFVAHAQTGSQSHKRTAYHWYNRPTHTPTSTRPVATPVPTRSVATPVPTQSVATPVPTQSVVTPTPTQSTGGTSSGAVACTNCWRPTLNTSFQWQLQGTIDQSYAADLYDIDGFDNSSTTVSELHSAGHKVACYIDAGSWENWRSDASQFPASVEGKALDGWPGEKWLDIRQLSILGPLMQARIAMCKTKGFDVIEFDNVDGYSNSTGFPLKASDQLTYNIWLANQAHTQGMSVLLKNDPDQVSTLVPYFDGELDEQCFEYQECDELVPFIQAGKPVFEVEYNLSTDEFCPQANQMDFFAQAKDINLGPSRTLCRTA